MAGRVSLLAAFAVGSLANAIPADPTITSPALLPRQADAEFIGWIELESTWYSQDCDESLTWYQSGGYAQCCPNTAASCDAPTACINGPGGGSQIYPMGSTTVTIACTSNYDDTSMSVCNTALIHESFGDDKPQTDIVCGPTGLKLSYYRKIPASVTELQSSDPPSSLLSLAGSAESSSPTATPEPSGGGSGSKAWIAGAVIGPIAGLALIGAIVFFLMRRKKSKSALPETGGASMGPPPGVQQPYTDAKPQMSPDPAYGQTAFNANGTYPQPGYGQQPTSPTPQYTQYNTAGTVPPEGAYAPEKHAQYAAPQQAEAAELGGSSSPGAPGQSHTAELPSNSVQK